MYFGNIIDFLIFVHTKAKQMIDKEVIKSAVEVIGIAVFYALTNEKIKKTWKKIWAMVRTHESHVKYEIKLLAKELETRLSQELDSLVSINVWQFQNGAYSMAGYGFKFMKLICHESTNGFYQQIQYSTIPVEPFVEFVSQLQKSDRYLINTITSDTTPDEVKAIFTELGIKMAIDMKFDNSDVYKGFISVSFPEIKNISENQFQLINEFRLNIYRRIKSLT
jgi:hypothetical protein